MAKDTDVFITNVMKGLEAAEDVMKSIEQDANAGLAMSPAQQLVLVRMMTAHLTFTRILANMVVQYQDRINDN